MFLIVLVCKDEIPSGCLNGTSPDMVPLEVHQDSCNGFIELGKALGISKECVCDIEWKNIQGHHISKDLMTCDMMTPGMVKDNCKDTCDSCMSK